MCTTPWKRPPRTTRTAKISLQSRKSTPSTATVSSPHKFHPHKIFTQKIPVIPTDESSDIPEEVKLYLQLKVATTWEELCRSQEDFKKGLADMLSKGMKVDFSPDRVVLLNDHECLEPPPETEDGISVHLYLQDEAGAYDMEATKSFPAIWNGQMDSTNLKVIIFPVQNFLFYFLGLFQH